MTGVGLEPTTNGLTYLIGFHRPTDPAWIGVESLDYLFAIAGVPRLVSEAGADESTGPLPADDPIPPAFQTVTIAVAGLVVVQGALRASQHTAASTRRGSASSRARLPFVC